MSAWMKRLVATLFGGPGARDPKPEIRNPKEIRNPNAEMGCSIGCFQRVELIRISSFGLPSVFGFRISDFITLLSLCTLLPLLPLPARGAPPNIVVILADDQGWGDLSINGNTNLSTPRIDSLARDGALLERFYACPVCSPTRAEFLTGRYHPRGGVRDVSRGGERLNLDEKTIADTFKAAGYATGAFGKWHNGTQYPYHPNARGFDEYYGFCSGHWGSYFDPPLEHNGKLVQGRGFIIDDLTDHALAFIATNQSRPFFCYVPFNTPHSPMQVPERFWQKFANADLKLRARNPAQEDVPFTRAALAMCENIDWNVGRILDRLEELKLADRTIVLYFSDNGPNSWRWNGGMKGRKGSVDEGGVREPFVIRWPGHIPGGARISQIAGAIDLLPTLADLAGISIASTKLLDGISLKPLLLGPAKEWPDRMIFSHWDGRVSVRTQRYRLDDNNRLFDLDTDPGQDHDISDKVADVTARLSKARAQWKAELLPGLTRDDRPFTVGYPPFPMTPLPARDGVPHGGVRRSASAPNCSFFTNWKSPEDRITWDIEIATAGKYEAVIYYTCPAADVGSTVEFNFLGSRLEGKVTEPNDPPLRGAENDRVPRQGESYVKEFKPMSLGTIELGKGRGLLTLRALTVPGKQVMDVRMVLLTLLR
jgi:arylsulfatase A-like enzyme